MGTRRLPPLIAIPDRSFSAGWAHEKGRCAINRAPLGARARVQPCILQIRYGRRGTCSGAASSDGRIGVAVPPPLLPSATWAAPRLAPFGNGAPRVQKIRNKCMRKARWEKSCARTGAHGSKKPWRGGKQHGVESKHNFPTSVPELPQGEKFAYGWAREYGNLPLTLAATTAE